MEARLKQHYELLHSELRYVRRKEALKMEIKQARFDLRDEQEKQLNYKGSIRSFLDGLSGKKEEKTEQLYRQVRNAESRLQSLLREQEEAEAVLAEIRERLAAVPEYEPDNPQRNRFRAELEAAYCAEVLRPLLEDNHKALLEYRSVLRGEYPIMSLEGRQEILTEPNIRAEKCLPWLKRLKKAVEVLEHPMELGSYYEAPEAYLVTVAAKHNQLDRVNNALGQVESLCRKIAAYK